MLLTHPTGPRHYKALTQTEALAVMFVILLLSVFALWFLATPRSGSRDLPPRSICAANLKGIGTGMYTYANENNGMWPIAPHLPAAEEGKGQVTYAPGKIGSHRGKANVPMAGETTDQDTEMSTTRNLWYLFRTNDTTPGSFICPCSDDVANDEEFLESFQDLPDYWDFRNYREISYGYQLPYGKRGQPSNDCNPEMPLIADKGPFGAYLEANEPNPGVPTAKWNDKPEEWRRWNSPNHNSEGQNVLFADGHVNWFSKPIIGIGKDNIYTQWSDATGGSDSDWQIQIQGTPPTSNETPFSNTDTLIYP